jgi:hypothetical protein
MEMPFGKHRGERIDTIPRGYLRWLSGNADLWGELKQAVECVLNGQPLPEPKDYDALIEAMFRDKAEAVEQP